MRSRPEPFDGVCKTRQPPGDSYRYTHTPGAGGRLRRALGLVEDRLNERVEPNRTEVRATGPSSPLHPPDLQSTVSLVPVVTLNVGRGSDTNDIPRF